MHDPYFLRLSRLDQRVSPQVSPSQFKDKRVSWLAIILVSVYFLALWAPPILSIPAFRWYFAMGLAIFAFLVQKKPLNLSAARFFWIVYGLGFLGAVLSLLRTSSQSLTETLWNTVGLGMSGVTYLLMIPVLATKSARKFMLLILIGAAIFSIIDIQRLLNMHGFLIYSTFGETKGGDKNHIAFGLSLAGFALLYLSLFWKPSKAVSRGLIHITRLILGIAGVVFLFYMALIYSRSAVLVTIVEIGVLLGMVFYKNLNRRVGLLYVGFALFIIFIATKLVIPMIIAASPQWVFLSASLQNEGLDAFDNRQILIEKGLYLVIENPILGIGVGQSINPISSYYGNFPGAWIHNTFLTDWAEKGILGLLSNVVWFLMYLGILRNKFFDGSIVDQIWLLLFIPLFFEMNFLDMSSISLTMLAILSGIDYEQHSLQQAEMKPGH